MIEKDTLFEILQRARWAPSGDNGQPWKFEFLEGNQIRIHVFHELDNVYEVNAGEPVWIAAGALLETLSIAASTKKLTCDVRALQDFQDGKGHIDVAFQESESLQDDPLAHFIEARSVLRFPYRLGDFSEQVANELEEAVGKNHTVKWLRSTSERWRAVTLNMKGSVIRLSIKEAYNVHKEVIDWENDLSPSGVPAKAVGMSFPTLLLTKWAMQSWERIRILMTYMGGTLIPRLEMDILPGLLCARHFVILEKQEIERSPLQSSLQMGRSVQRFWLCATKNNLVIQPGMAPIIFAKHAIRNNPFTQDSSARDRAKTLAGDVERVWGVSASKIGFTGRIGFPRCPPARDKIRSVRKEVRYLMQNK